MNLIRYFAGLPWVEPLGWTLIHFLWEGALIGMLAWIILRVAHFAAPKIRYAVALGAMILCVAAPVSTFVILAKPFAHGSSEPRVLKNAAVEGELSQQQAQRDSGEGTFSTGKPQANLQAGSVGAPQPSQKQLDGSTLDQWIRWNVASWGVGLWFFGVLLKVLQLAGGWCRIQQWRCRSESAHGSTAWVQDLFESLAERIGQTRGVRLLFSRELSSPLTLGFVRPVVILPFSILSGVPKECLEAILLHELAHIRRHDYLVNLLQSAVEVVLFYHPAVWWIGKELRQIREECADRLAADLGSGPIGYAKALTLVEEFRTQGIAPAIGADGGSLLVRIKRLFGMQQPESVCSGRNAAWFTALGAAALVAACLICSPMFAQEETIAVEKPAPSGVVIDEAGHPVAEATVWVYSVKSGWGLGNGSFEQTTSDQNGHFAFKKALPFEVPNGSADSDHYYLFARKPGKASAWATIIAAGSSPAAFILVLTPPKSQTFEVVDLKGKPVKGARVWLRYASSQFQRDPRFSEDFITPEDAQVASTITDESGHATLADLPDTERSIAVSCAGCEDVTSCSTSPEGVVRFVVKPEAVLEGRVTDPLGMAVEGAVVALYPRFSYYKYFLARTDKDGRYRIGKIWCNGKERDWGTYSVSIRHPRLVALQREVHFGSGETKSGFDIQAIAGTQIAGTLLDPETHQPVAGGRVTIRSKLSGERTCWSDEKGGFSVAVAPGPIAVLDARPPQGHYFATDLRGGCGYFETTVFGERFPLAVTLQGAVHRLGSLSGAVTLPDGSPAAWCAVQTFLPQTGVQLESWRSTELRSVYTNQNGRFANTAFPTELEFGLYAETPDGKFAGFLVSDQHGTGKPVHLQLQPTLDRSFAVTGWEGKPLRKTTVRVCPVFGDANPSLAAQAARTDNEGNLRLAKLLPGVTYELSAGDDASQKAVLVSDKQETESPKAICLSDRIAVRLVGASGEPIGIAAFKSFTLHLIEHGRPLSWSNPTTLPILARRNTEAIVPRKGFTSFGSGTNKSFEFQIQTTSGAIVSATAAMLANGSNLIEAIATQPLQSPKVAPDPGISVPSKDLAGRVLDPSGHPVQGAQIALLNAWWLPRDFRIESDSEGVFRIPDVDNKPYTCLQILKEGFAPLWLADLSVGKPFRVQLHNTTRLRGKLFGPDGTPSAQAEIKLETEIYTASERRPDHKITGLLTQGDADASGNYDLPVEPGVYRYQVAGKNGGFLRGEISVGPSEIKSLPEHLQPGASASLTVVDVQTGKPIPGVLIVIEENVGPYSIAPRKGSERTTDETGRVYWDNLLPGTTQFCAPNMAHNGGPNGGQLPYSRWWSDTMANSSSQVDYKLRLPKKGEGDQNISFDILGDFKATIQMERGVEVSGTVMDSKGNPIAGGTILTVPEEGRRESLTGDSRYWITADTSGAFHGFLPAGNGVVYNLCASSRERPFANAVSEPFLSKPGDKFQFRLQAPKGSWVTGRVVDANGKRGSAVKVQATASDYMDSPYADKTCPIDSKGAFRIGPLRPGKYEIRPDTEGGVNINPRIAPTYITVEDGKDLSLGDLVVSEKE